MIWILLQGHFCSFPLVIWNNSWGRERSKQKLAWWPYLYHPRHPWLPVRVSDLILSALDHAVNSTHALCHVIIKVAGVRRTAAQPHSRQRTHRKWYCLCYTEVNGQGSLSRGTSLGFCCPSLVQHWKGGWGYSVFAHLWCVCGTPVHCQLRYIRNTLHLISPRLCLLRWPRALLNFVWPWTLWAR